MTPQSPSMQAPWDLTQFSQSPSAAPLYFPESHQQSEISSLSKVILVLGKARSHRAPNLGCSRAESPGKKTQHFARKLCTRRDVLWVGMLSWWSCQSPVAHVALWTTQTVSTEEYSNLTQNLIQIRWPTCSVILNATATQYTCSLNCIYHPHWLVQWSCHCSHMRIPVHFPWLPSYINVVQTVLLY